MRKAHLLAAGAALCLATSAQAALTVTLDPNPSDYSEFNIFSGETANTFTGAGSFSAGGYQFSGNGWIANGPTIGFAAPPLALDFPDNYMAVGAFHFEDISMASTNTMTVAFSSLDNLNVWKIGNYILTGAQLRADIGGQAYGLVTFYDSDAFHDVIATSGINSFEFSPENRSNPVPEPSTWAMMAIGFVGLGYAALKRRATPRLATVA